jgi:ribosomal protein S18 acetylase RimI-like enzyme
MNASPTPQGPGSASGSPNLPAGFTGTFTSRFVGTGGLRLHAVTGGDGPPLLLVHGWPQTWYAWRMLMPSLARDFSVVAVDQRGIGLSDKPQDGYDTARLVPHTAGVRDTDSVITVMPSASDAGLRLLPGGIGEVTRVYVMPAARRRGLGSRLLDELETHARDHQVTTLRLDTRRDLVEARRLYVSHGYTEVRPFSHGPYSDHWFVKDGPFGT